jgi:hypothetical protein
MERKGNKIDLYTLHNIISGDNFTGSKKVTAAIDIV